MLSLVISHPNIITHGPPISIFFFFCGNISVLSCTTYVCGCYTRKSVPYNTQMLIIILLLTLTLSTIIDNEKKTAAFILNWNYSNFEPSSLCNCLAATELTIIGILIIIVMRLSTILMKILSRLLLFSLKMMLCCMNSRMFLKATAFFNVFLFFGWKFCFFRFFFVFQFSDSVLGQTYILI